MTSRNEELFARAQRHIPAGVNSPVRAFRAVGGTPPFCERASGAHLWDAGVLLQNALPVALKKASPGTPAFRQALRDALEGLKNVSAAHGVFNMSPTDHLGFDQRAAVMVEIRNGTWTLIK